MLTGCSNNKENNNETTTPKVFSFDEVLASRRSVRSYDATKTISEAEVRELLISTQEAPSWANQQPTKYYVAMTPEKVEAVSNLVGERNKQNIAGAPVRLSPLTRRASRASSVANRPTRWVMAGAPTTTASATPISS